MSKFIIECPSCHNYCEAKTGFFASKKINCSCGYDINLKTDRITIKKCASCGNNVAFDQAKGVSAVCPVCRANLISREDYSSILFFRCSMCGSGLSAEKGQTEVICPICDSVQDVQRELALQQLHAVQEANFLTCDINSGYLLWKHPNVSFEPGATLMVKAGQEAVFFKNGKAVGPFGAGEHVLAAENSEVFRICEVFYINCSPFLGLKWGTSTPINVIDPSGISLDIGVSGTFSIRVCDSVKFLTKMVGGVDANTFEQLFSGNMIFFRQMIMSTVKSHLAQIIKEKEFSILGIEAHLDEIGSMMKEAINRDMAEYGMVLPEFYIVNVLYPENDSNFRRLKQQYAEFTLGERDRELRRRNERAEADRRVEAAQTNSAIREIEAKGDANADMIRAHAEAEKKRMEAEAEAKRMYMMGFTYDQETERMVKMEKARHGISPDPVQTHKEEAGWSCACGQKGLQGSFCPNCGAKKPDAGWSCACGQKGLQGSFCPNCGAKKP